MPNRETHALVGAAAGLLAAGVRVQHAPACEAAAESLGGLLGGWLGGVLPDVLEPATSPSHRRLAHSVAAGGALTLARVAEWQAGCRATADGASRRAAGHPIGSVERRNADFEAFLWRVAAGCLVGLVAGYASHLVLDSGTARGLPLIGA